MSAEDRNSGGGLGATLDEKATDRATREAVRECCSSTQTDVPCCV